MAKIKTIISDGANTSGTGADNLTALTYIQFPHGVVIVDLVQASSGTAANDADWDLYVDGKVTDWSFRAEELNPASVERIKLMQYPGQGIRIRPMAVIQFKWSGQAAAASNYLKMIYEVIR